MKVSTSEGINIFQAVNDYLDKITSAKNIHKEQKLRINFAARPVASIIKPNLIDIGKICQFKINAKIITPG